ncbi:hypothetical protein F4604DRAFT_1674765 [Suillus subluteus]|nr:hypothetical protein F4604DRAFT_1674765 [Suillus subluteus]
MFRPTHKLLVEVSSGSVYLVPLTGAVPAHTDQWVHREGSIPEWWHLVTMTDLVLRRHVSKTDNQDKDKDICERDDDRKGGHTKQMIIDNDDCFCLERAENTTVKEDFKEDHLMIRTSREHHSQGVFQGGPPYDSNEPRTPQSRRTLRRTAS